MTEVLQPLALPGKDAWDAAVVANPDGGNILQTWEFAQLKQHSGWQPRLFGLGELTIVVHEKPMLALGKQWYVPKGPGVTSTGDLDTALAALAAEARRRGVVSLVVEPEVAPTPENLAVLRRHGFAGIDPIQPTASTIVVDLSRPREDVWAALKHKHRYIRKAEREGVVVEHVAGTQAELDEMWEMYADTITRAGLRLRSKEYHQRTWRTFLDAGSGHLFLARHEGRPLAGAFIVLLGRRSVYKDGASIADKSFKGMSYLLQWRCIEWAMDNGALEHDLAGSPPSDRIDDRDHPLYGIGVFKREFSTDVRDFVGTQELVLKPRAEALWNKVGERIWRRTVGVRLKDPFFF